MIRNTSSYGIREPDWHNIQWTISVSVTRHFGTECPMEQREIEREARKAGVTSDVQGHELHRARVPGMAKTRALRFEACFVSRSISNTSLLTIATTLKQNGKKLSELAPKLGHHLPKGNGACL